MIDPTCATDPVDEAIAPSVLTRRAALATLAGLGLALAAAPAAALADEAEGEASDEGEAAAEEAAGSADEAADEDGSDEEAADEEASDEEEEEEEDYEPYVGSPVWRLYNPYSGEHHFTLDTNERDTLVGLGWTHEGIAWNAPGTGASVWRLYNEYSGDHHYTTDENEYATLAAAGWTQEGEAFLSAPGSAEGTYEIWRLYNPYASAFYHHFTTDSNEYSTLASLGWEQEGVAFRGTLTEGWNNVDGSYYYYELASDGSLAARTGWLTTSDNPLSTSTSSHSYWLAADTGKLAVSRLVSESEIGYWAYATAYGWMATGKHTDSSTGYVYLADSSGELEDPGWVVTSAYESSGELERYYIDSTYRACVPGYSTAGWAHYTTSAGYVLRNDFVKVSGTWYYADDDGLCSKVTARSDWVQYGGTWYYADSTGACSECTDFSGNSTLDAYLVATYRSEGTSLKALFQHVVDNYTHSSGSTYPTGAFSIPFAVEMIENGTGNCYRSGALFCWLARGIGYDAHAVSGYVPKTNGGRIAHGWCEIEEGGTRYIYDANEARTYPTRNWFGVTYSNAPVTYVYLTEATDC